MYGLCVVYFFTFQSTDLSNKIDGSWQYTLSALRASPQDLGVDIFYTYGPTFERIVTYPSASDSFLDFIISGFIVSIIIAGSIFTLRRVFALVGSKISKPLAHSILLYLVFFLVSSSFIDSLFYLSLILTLFTLHYEETLQMKLFSILAIAPLALFKVSFTITLLLLIPFAFLHLGRKYKTTIRSSLVNYLVCVTGFISAFSVLSFSAPWNILDYVRYGLLNSVAYTEFMGLGVGYNIATVLLFSAIYFGAAILSILSIFYLFRRHGWEKSYPFIMGLLFVFASSFFAFKQSIVRSDAHLLSFIPFIPLIILGALSVAHSVKHGKYLLPARSLVMCVLAGTFLCYLGVNTAVYGRDGLPSQLTQKISSVSDIILHNPVSYPAFVSLRTDSSQQIRSLSKESEGLSTYLRENFASSTPIVFYGNRTALADSMNRGDSMAHMPFVQNYAAFPPQLFDNLYIHFLENRSNSLLIVEESEPSINERIPAHELSNFFQYIRANYKQIYGDTNKRQYILKPNSSPRKESCRIQQTFTTAKEKAITLPSGETGSSYLKMKMNFKKAPTESLFGLMLKKPIYLIDLVTPSGAKMTMRTTQSTLEHGIALSPLYISYTDVVNKTPFDLNHFVIRGGLDKTSAVTVTYSICSFN